MKKKIKVIFLIIIFNFFLNHSAYSETFKWKKVVRSKSNSTELFYDDNTVLKVGNNVYFWQLTNNLGNIKDNIFSTISHVMVNCKTFEARNITYTDFKRPMMRGDHNFEMIVPENLPDLFEWIYYDREETIQGIVLDQVCEKS